MEKRFGSKMKVRVFICFFSKSIIVTAAYNLHDISRFVQFAVNVFGCELNAEHPEETAKAGIKALREFFRSLNMPEQPWEMMAFHHVHEQQGIQNNRFLCQVRQACQKRMLHFHELSIPAHGSISQACQ